MNNSISFFIRPHIWANHY